MTEAQAQAFLHVLLRRNDLIGATYINKIVSRVSALLDEAYSGPAGLSHIQFIRGFMISAGVRSLQEKFACVSMHVLP